MASEKATAIVLRYIDFSESSAIVTLLTREFGKVGALAKGAKRPKGPFESALDLLSVCRIVFLRKSSDALDLLTEAKLERRFRPAGNDLISLYAGYYVAELLAALTDDYDPHPELFDAAEQTLKRLASGAPVAPWVLRFELTTLRLLGHLPSLDLCVECGQSVTGGKRIAFGLYDGGVLCTGCRVGKRAIVSVSQEVINTLSEYSRPLETHEDESNLTLDRRVLGELRGVLNQYLYQLVGRKLKMHEYLTTVCT